MHDLKGKVALVAGAGSIGPGWGNGKATAALLARQGASVLAADIVAAAAEETRGVIESEGGVCATTTVDVTDARSVQAMVETCVARFGRIDILINNVGGSVPGDPVTMPEEVWDAQVAYNLKSVFLGCKYALPVMEQQGSGVIVNLSSVAGLRHLGGGRDQVAYAATKSAVIQFTRSTAIAYAKKGIRCNTVIPGLMHTPLLEARLAPQVAGGDVDKLIAQRNAQVPMGRMGDGWDVANAILFLVSDEARYITATEIVVDGGLIAAA